MNLTIRTTDDSISVYGSSRKLDESTIVSDASYSSNRSDDEGVSVSRKEFVLKSVLAVCILIAGIYTIQSRRNAAATASNMISRTDMNTETTLGMIPSKETSPIRLQTYNMEYSKSLGLTALSYPFINVGLLAEPQRQTTVEISVDRNSYGTCSFTIDTVTGGGPWDDIPNVVPAKNFTASGDFSSSTESDLRIGVVKFPSPGVYRSTSSCTSLDGSSDATLTRDVLVLYVRRELRQLTDSDRASFVHCFKTMITVNLSEGQKKYGSHYKPIEKFEIMHLDAAGSRHADHFHDGMGLTTQHAAMSSEFELSMQSILPSVTLPFWDYTLDQINFQTHGENHESSIFKESKLFTEQWFGETDSESHIVTKGPLAYQEISRNYSYSKHSAYGFLRAPWNINPNKYVTRFHKLCGSKVDDDGDGSASELEWPTCASHFKYTNTDSVSAWGNWSYNIGYLPHGPVHSWIGGVGGMCESGWDDMEEKGWITATQLKNLKHFSFVMLKNMWREYVIEMPKYCSPDTDVSQCMWKCSEGHLNSSHTTSFFEAFIDLDSSHSHYKKVVNRVLCETPYWPGDQLEAASPVDISFWPIHPTIERLLQYKTLVRPFKDNTWTTDKTATCLYYNDSSCEGHNPEDATHFKLTHFDTIQQRYVSEQLSNQKVRESTSPIHGYAIPYVYGDFEWSHCDGETKFKEVEKSRVATIKTALG